MAQALIQAGIDIGLQLIVITLNFSGNMMGTLITDWDAKLTEAAKAVAQKIQEAKDLGKKVEAAVKIEKMATQFKQMGLNLVKQQPGYYNQWLHAEGWSIGKPAASLQRAKNPEKESVHRLQEAPFQLHSATGFCGMYFDVYLDESTSQTNTLVKYINAHMDALRYLLSDFFESLFTYDLEGNANTNLTRHVILDRDWLSEPRRNYEKLEEYEFLCRNCFQVRTDLMTGGQKL